MSDKQCRLDQKQGSLVSDLGLFALATLSCYLGLLLNEKLWWFLVSSQTTADLLHSFRLDSLCKIFSKQHFEIFVLFFPFHWRQFAWNVKTSCLNWKKKLLKMSNLFSGKNKWRQFAWNGKTCFLGKVIENFLAWNVKTYFQGKIRKIFQSVVYWNFFQAW